MMIATKTWHCMFVGEGKIQVVESSEAFADYPILSVERAAKARGEVPEITGFRFTDPSDVEKIIKLWGLDSFYSVSVK